MEDDEIIKLREENEKLKASISNPPKKKSSSNKSFVQIIAASLAAVVVIIIVLIFVLHVFSISTSASSLKPSINANASGSFFLGPEGESLGSTYINGLSDLSSQLASVGAQQVAGSFIHENASDGSNGPSPGYYVLVYGNTGGKNYDIIPITVPSTFSNYSISQNGKPTIVFFGSQGCPFSGQDSWVLAIALSRFGNFSKLFYVRSATDDWNLPAIMFNFSQSAFNKATKLPPIDNGQAPFGDANPEPLVSGAYYTSKYINFEPLYELGGSFLINTTGVGQINPIIYSNVYALGMRGFNLNSNGIIKSSDGFGIQNFFIGGVAGIVDGVAFIDINNKFVFNQDINNVESILDLKTNSVFSNYSTHQDILDSIENPTSGSFGQTVLGAANILTAQICKTLNNTAPVCSLSYISKLESKISSLNYS
ncbi:MAG: DUF929 domain-containing protein [Candidatus Parvarchaeota archaeon]|nr:DUF929 domain-containing protein [Candidatus Parvarchaeum tengchongense]MCW1298908.1 DUF929 domain-containing protein [Candidatus Parvarchaeum tengchongense]MCW1311882.1 DUF929 domain-containing protein [Candidatus Parvarchaeum tengchongense]